MQQTSIRLFSATLLLFALPLGAQDWTGRSRIRGKVTEETGQPVVGATVTLTLREAGPAPIKSDENGEWSYLGLARGTGLGHGEFEGYVPRETEVPLQERDKAKTPVEMTLRAVTPEMLAQANPAVAHIETGNALLAEEKPAEARAEYEMALESIDPDSHAYVYLTIARTYYLEDNLEQTEATLRKALELEPDNVDGLKLMSNLLISAGRESEAQEFMARLPETDRLPADAYLNVGIELYNNGDLDAALVKFEEAAASYPEEPSVYYYRGLVYVAQGNNDPAAADFRKLLELEGEGPRAEEAREFLKYLE